MASSWGTSWLTSWKTSWGTTAAAVTPATTPVGGVGHRRMRYRVEIDGEAYDFSTEQQAIDALYKAHDVARKAIRERELKAKQAKAVAKPVVITPPPIVVPDDTAAIKAAAEEVNRKIAVAYAQAQLRAEAMYAAYLEQEDEDEAITMLLH